MIPFCALVAAGGAVAMVLLPRIAADVAGFFTFLVLCVLLLSYWLAGVIIRKGRHHGG